MNLGKVIAAAIVLLVTYLLTIDCAFAEDLAEGKISNGSVVAEDKQSYTIASFNPNELSWRNDIEKALKVGGVIICSVFLIGGLAWLLSPAFRLKMCHLFGQCESEATPYARYASNLQALAQPNAFSGIYAAPFDSYGGASYRKRSLDYLGPIIKTLASAYEKYDPATSTVQSETAKSA